MNDLTLKKDNTNRIRTLQGARFLFVAFIYLSHCVTPNVSTPFDFGGDIGVSFFFILSGFVMSWGYGPSVSRGEFSTRSYFWHHFWRLYPLHVLLFALMLALDSRLGHKYDWVQTLSTLFLVQSWIPSNHTLYNINAVSWFLCDTLFFYLIFKQLYAWLMSIDIRRRRYSYALLAFVSVYLIAASLVPADMTNCTLYANPLLRTIDFAIGIMAYRLYKLGTTASCPTATPLLNLPLAVYVLAGFVFYLIYQCLGYNGCRCAALFWPFMPLFILKLVSADGTNDPVARLLACRPMLWLGGISFELFMVHLFAMRLTQHFIPLGDNVLYDYMYFAVAFVVAVVMAWLLHIGFVKPVGNVINRLFLRS